MTTSALPQLIVDRRQDPKFTRALTNHFNVVEKQLKVGDLLWSCPLGMVGVEDKRFNGPLSDLMVSLRNKRLDDELRRLVAYFAVPVLFIRGDGNGAMAEVSYEKMRFGRQLHGVYIWQAPSNMADAAESLRGLYDYLAMPHVSGIEGVRRERRLGFAGRLGPRAEVIYGILGLTQGVRNRRYVAESIAEATPLSEFLRWTASDFTFVGFSAHMAMKLAGVVANLEERPSN